MLRAHETEDKDQSDEEEEEALDVIQMDIYSEDDPRRDTLTICKDGKCHIQTGRVVVHFHHQSMSCARVRPTSWLTRMQVHHYPPAKL